MFTTQTLAVVPVPADQAGPEVAHACPGTWSMAHIVAAQARGVQEAPPVPPLPHGAHRPDPLLL